MDVTPLIPSDRKVITGYGPGIIRVNDEAFQDPVVVWPTQTAPWAVGDPQALTETDFQFLTDTAMDEPLEVLLIGTGARMQFIPPALREAIRKLGPVADIMDTGAACRTYNVLLAEGRPIAAALLPVVNDR